MKDENLRAIAADLRRRADANVLDIRALDGLNPDQFQHAATELCAEIIDVRGQLVRLQYTRDRLGSRDFYHLSIATQPPTRLDPEEVMAIITVFFPDGKALLVPSVLGNSIQFMGVPFANGIEPRTVDRT